MSANEVLTALLDAMPDSYQKTIGFPTYDLLAAVSLRLAETDAVIEDARAALDPENLTGGELDRYIYPRSGIARKAATFAGGVLTVKGTGTIEQGTLFESAGGVQFAAAETVAIDGTGEVPVTCRADGTAKRLGYNDNLGTGINLKEHVKYEYLSLDGSKDSELNGSGGCLILPGWRSGPWGMQMRFDMRWNALFIRRYRDEATLWDDWERLAICAPPEVHGLPLASGFPAQSYANTYYKTQEGIVHLNFCIFRGESTAFAEPETICTMPKGYRPSIVIAAAVGGDGKSFGNGLPAAELHIEPDGRMWFYGSDARINWVYGEITYLTG